MRNIRLQVPTSVSAACHYAAQIAGCSVSEVYGTILFVTSSRMTEAEFAECVKSGLSKYRAALTVGHTIAAKKGV